MFDRIRIVIQTAVIEPFGFDTTELYNLPESNRMADSITARGLQELDNTHSYINAMFIETLDERLKSAGCNTSNDVIESMVGIDIRPDIGQCFHSAVKRTIAMTDSTLFALTGNYENDMTIPGFSVSFCVIFDSQWMWLNTIGSIYTSFLYDVADTVYAEDNACDIGTINVTIHKESAGSTLLNMCERLNLQGATRKPANEGLISSDTPALKGDFLSLTDVNLHTIKIASDHDNAYLNRCYLGIVVTPTDNTKICIPVTACVGMTQVKANMDSEDLFGTTAVTVSYDTAVHVNAHITHPLNLEFIRNLVVFPITSQTHVHRSSVFVADSAMISRRTYEQTITSPATEVIGANDYYVKPVSPPPFSSLLALMTPITIFGSGMAEYINAKSGIMTPVASGDSGFIRALKRTFESSYDESPDLEYISRDNKRSCM